MAEEQKEKKSGQRSEYLSKEGLAQLKETLTYSKTVCRKEIAERLEYAKGLGDLSENSEYHEAKEAQMENESLIMELEDTISRSVILTKADNINQISHGSTIIVAKSGSAEPIRFILVGPSEADPSNFKISYESPLGQALLDRKKNEEVKVITPRGEVKYKILDII